MPIGAIISGVSAIGGIVGSIFGGKAARKEASSAVNLLRQPDVLGGFLETGISANQQIAQLLGLGGGTTTEAGRNVGADQAFNALGGTGPSGVAGGTSALNEFFQSAGGEFILGRGAEAITGSAAASGLLGSGSTLKSLAEFGSNVGSTFFQNFLSNLNVLSSQGLAAGQTIGGAAVPAAQQRAGITQDVVSSIAGFGGTLLGGLGSLGGGGGGGAGATGGLRDVFRGGG